MTPPAAPGPLRTAVERRSAPLLAQLGRRPGWLVPVVGALLLGGVLFLPSGASGLCLVGLLVLVGWLSYLSWPVLDPTGRVLRVAGLGLLVLLGLTALLS